MVHLSSHVRVIDNMSGPLLRPREFMTQASMVAEGDVFACWDVETLLAPRVRYECIGRQQLTADYPVNK